MLKNIKKIIDVIIESDDRIVKPFFYIVASVNILILYFTDITPMVAIVAALIISAFIDIINTTMRYFLKKRGQAKRIMY